MIDIDKFIDEQLACWPQARDNFDALRNVETKQIGWSKVQFNPARIVSTGAKVDASAIAQRKCFLCDANRPQEQMGIDWGEYKILVNPFPIFPRHLTVPLKGHQPQRIKGRIADMCRLAKELPGYVVFYNGPKCGASAPDHFHFQAGNADFLPDYENEAPFGKILLSGYAPEAVAAGFDNLYASLEEFMHAEEEPMMNVLCRYADGAYRLTVIPRKRHRPSFYGTEEGQMLVSPASVDLCGVMITPLKRDFDAMDKSALDKIYSQLCFSQSEIQELLSNE